MKRGLAILAVLVLALGFLSGCGGSGDTSAATEDTAASSESADSGNGSYGGNMMPQTAETSEAENGEDQLLDAKMIYTATMDVETTAFDVAAAGLRQMVEDMGGYFEQASVYNYGDGYRSGNYVIRVPSDQFQNLLTQVGELCHVVRKEESSDNISTQYYDTESRLVTQQTKLERLQTLLSQAETMEDIITIESAISDTELAIEQLTGTLRQYDSLVDFSTVTISLQEVYKLSNVEEPATTFASRLGQALVSGWNGFLDILEALVMILAYAWVLVLVVLVIAGVLLWRLLRKKKAQKGNQPPENGAS
ncbi:DUF4349 domain-containing protein [Dysosmobacter sp.]|uniref:DUF4349 domain-containing protein n=1 Tax=Dysosmobacter sp. TaxID=2591382 RepID=UPI003A92E9C7